jgi:hypothetical protein
VQKHSAGYSRYETGNIVGFATFEEYLRATHNYGHFRTKILKTMKEAIWISTCSCKRKLNERDRANTFEIFGYDFMLDQSFKPWLIEVNTNPSIELSSPLLAQLIPRMLDDAFKLTVDQIFKRPAPIGPHVEGYRDEDNMWELIGGLIEANRNVLNKKYTFVKR